jgi:CheY-like chemotaxis protein
MTWRAQLTGELTLRIHNGVFGDMAPLPLLIVDDDLGTLETYEFILKPAGYEVVTASSGCEGLRLFETEKFVLVLTDLRMPDLSGLEFLAEVRTSECKVPIVIVTAWGTDATAAAAKELGARDFVYKPLDADALLHIVRRNAQPLKSDESTVHRQSPPFIGYAARRWATVVLAMTKADDDIPTVAAWGAEVGVAHATLKTWCSVAGVHAGDSLNFARLMRIVVTHQGRKCDWHNALAVVDARTMVKLLRRANLSRDSTVPSLSTFLSGQRFITSAILIDAIQTLLDVH